MFEGTVDEMLMLYSVLCGQNTSETDNKILYDELKSSIKRIDPEFVLKDELTSYEAFCLVTRKNESNITMISDVVEGYSEDNFTPWDPIVPIDDTQQYPDDKCVHRQYSETPHIGFTLDDEIKEPTIGDVYQGDVAGLIEEIESSPFDQTKIIVDTDQMPDEDNVSTTDRRIFSNEYARRDF